MADEIDLAPISLYLLITISDFVRLINSILFTIIIIVINVI